MSDSGQPKLSGLIFNTYNNINRRVLSMKNPKTYTKSVTVQPAPFAKSRCRAFRRYAPAFAHEMALPQPGLNE